MRRILIGTKEETFYVGKSTEVRSKTHGLPIYFPSLAKFDSDATIAETSATTFKRNRS
jgi:hypothetical protein